MEKFQSLLCLAWAAAIFPIVAAALPIPGSSLVHRLLAPVSSRGKTARHSSSSSASNLKFTVPQKYFLHFYVVGVTVTTVLLVAIWFYAYMKMTPLSAEPTNYSSTVASHIVGGSNSFSLSNFFSRPKEHKYRVWQTVFVLLFMEVQVLRRLYETEHVFHYSPRARMHIVTYLMGLIYYVAAPLSLASSFIPEAMQYLRGQVAKFIINGRARTPDLWIDSSSLLKPLVMLGWCQWIGAVIFIWGSVHQIRCHAILGSLRKHRASDEYVIPHGDWFDRVSCPHYLAEVVIYFGMLVASGGSDIPVWFVFLFVIANLSFEAIQTHKWYLQKFEDYPRYRNAIIPFVC